MGIVIKIITYISIQLILILQSNLICKYFQKIKFKFALLPRYLSIQHPLKLYVIYISKH